MRSSSNVYSSSYGSGRTASLDSKLGPFTFTINRDNTRIRIYFKANVSWKDTALGLALFGTCIPGIFFFLHSCHIHVPLSYQVYLYGTYYNYGYYRGAYKLKVLLRFLRFFSCMPSLISRNCTRRAGYRRPLLTLIHHACFLTTEAAMYLSPIMDGSTQPYCAYMGRFL